MKRLKPLHVADRYGEVLHVDPEHFDAATFADTWFLVSFDLRLAGMDDGRMAGVVYGSDLDDGLWYPCIALRIVDEMATYSLDLEDAAALAAEFRRRSQLPEVAACPSSFAFYQFFATVLPLQIDEAAAKNARGDVPPADAPSRVVPHGRLSATVLALMPCIGTAAAMMILKVDAYHDRVWNFITAWGSVPLTFSL